MKSLNQQIFEQVLESMFPGKYIYHRNYLNPNGGSLGERISDNNKNPHSLMDFLSLEDAFWLAEKVGLFDHIALEARLMRYGGKWEITVCDQIEEHKQFYADTIPKVICKTVLAIYGKKP